MSDAPTRTFSPKVAPYAQALLQAGYSIHPRWTAQQIVGSAQNLLPGHAEAVRVGREKAWAKMRRGEGFIYLVEALDHYPIVKIGYALDIDKRMKVLAKEYRSLGAFRLLRAAPGDFRRERWLHSCMTPHRWPQNRSYREFYRADYLYHRGIDLPQGFMVSLHALLNRREAA